MMTEAQRPPLQPFTFESAVEKVRLAEDGWNSRDPVDSQWRNRAEFVTGRDAIVAFRSAKWRREIDYRLIKELWRLTTIVSPSGLPMSGATIVGTGSDRSGTRIGSLTIVA